MNLTARTFVLCLALLGMGGCASTQSGTVPDPYEDVNRKIFAFNDALDSKVLAPVARGYDAVMPAPVDRGISNFFANLYDFNGAINGILQWRWRGVAQNSGRFLVNSTVGMLGFIDIASEMGIPPYRTDFGHTLARWGADPGPYLMIPFFGPRTLRSGGGFVADTFISVQGLAIDSWATRIALYGVEVIDSRAAVLDAESLISGDRYIFIRDIYLQQREAFVNDGVVQDSFSDFDEDFEWEE